jgi:hypothetical protein
MDQDNNGHPTSGCPLFIGFKVIRQTQKPDCINSSQPSGTASKLKVGFPRRDFSGYPENTIEKS